MVCEPPPPVCGALLWLPQQAASPSVPGLRLAGHLTDTSSYSSPGSSPPSQGSNSPLYLNLCLALSRLAYKSTQFLGFLPPCLQLIKIFSQTRTVRYLRRILLPTIKTKICPLVLALCL